MSPRKLPLLPLPLLVVLAGCYRPSLPRCAVSCGSAGDCPGDLACVNGLCVAAGDDCSGAVDGGGGDGGGGIDGGVVGVWMAISSGAAHTCAIAVDRTLWCWGNNDSRQLGSPAPAQSGTPLQVDAQGAADWAQVFAGERHSCAIRDDGSLWCWGLNDVGQCGFSGGQFAAPARVSDPPMLGGTRWVDVAVGSFYSCAVRDDGSLWCFGRAVAGQLGQGQEMGQSAVPLRVGAGSDWRSVDSGLYHLCGVFGADGARGQLFCWGYDDGDGVIGDGGATSRFAPTEVDDGGAIDWREVAVGNSGSCGLDADGALYCWGREYYIPTTTPSTVPVRYGSVTGLERLTLGNSGGCHLAGGLVSCWGFNGSGQLGVPPPQAASDPVVVSGLGTVTAVDAGDGHVCALDAAGAVACWGDRGEGQLGDGVVGDRREPTEVLGGHHPWRQVDVGVDTTCAVNEADELYCWGLNGDGQVGGGNAMVEPLYDAPVRAGASGAWARVAVGRVHACALAASGGALHCWGGNDHEQRGFGGIAAVYEPTMVDAVGLSWVSIGLDSSCGVAVADGARRCWGQNDFTQLGNGMASTAPVAMPTPIAAGPAAWSRVTVGVSFGCGISGGAQPGILYCWGQNYTGQAAQDPTMDDPVVIPVQVPDPTVAVADGWIDVAGGLDHACGVLSEAGAHGPLYCWGQNSSGQRGDSGPSGHVLRAVAGATDFTAVDVGAAHTCALRATGALHCFGANDAGQLGDGTTSPRGSIGPSVGGFGDWVAFSAGNRSSCGIRGAERRLYCWGDNPYGQLGTGGGARWVPEAVPRP